MFGTSFGNSASSGGAFAPSDIDGLKLWLDADAANVNTEAAADFVSSSSEYLSSVSTAFNKGNESFSFGGWVKFDNAATQSSIIAKWGNLASTLKKSYLLWNSGGAIEVVLSNDGTTNNSRVSSAVSISSSVWYFCVFVYDSVNNLLKISVNAETFVTATDSIGPYNPASPYQLDFARLESGFYGNQQQDLSFFYDKALSQSEVTALYNSGNAIAYDSLSAAQKTDLVSWWSLSETSGTRYDQVITSANNLTDNNSVGWAAGILDEPVVNNSPVSLWIDKSTATNNATQATAISQATWKSSGFGTNSKPYLNFDGVNDFMSVANSSDIQLQAMTIFMVNLPRVNAAFEGALDKWGSSQGWMIEYTSGATQGQTRITAGTSSLLSSVDVTNLENITSILIDGASSSISVNGVTTTGTLNVTPTITQDLILGGDNVSTLRLDVDMAEILIYNAVLTSGEITQVETYLNTKYAAYSPPIGAFSSAFSNAFNIT